VERPFWSGTTVCRAICFVAGAAVEAYTYKLNPGHSVGLGWGVLAAMLRTELTREREARQALETEVATLRADQTRPVESTSETSV
jgi:hypothetical protein